MKPTDEYRTPEWLGTAMAKAAGLTQFDLDPFCSPGFSGIPAKRKITAEQDAFKVDWNNPRSVGFNVPFSMHSDCLDRIIECIPDDIPCVGIVRSDTSTNWWGENVRPFFPFVAFFHRMTFCDVNGRMTEGSPRSGIAVVARNVDWDVFRTRMELSNPKTPWVVRSE